MKSKAIKNKFREDKKKTMMKEIKGPNYAQM